MSQRQLVGLYYFPEINTLQMWFQDDGEIKKVSMITDASSVNPAVETFVWLGFIGMNPQQRILAGRLCLAWDARIDLEIVLREEQGKTT